MENINNFFRNLFFRQDFFYERLIVKECDRHYEGLFPDCVKSELDSLFTRVRGIF